MSTICTFYGILIQMFWQDHAPPHFHVLYAEHEALIDIRTLEVIGGNLPRRAHALGARVGAGASRRTDGGLEYSHGRSLPWEEARAPQLDPGRAHVVARGL